jgi:hypothetical protein
MKLDFGRLITRSFQVCWQNRWLAVLGAPTGGGGSGALLAELGLYAALGLAVAVGAAVAGVGVDSIIAVVVAIVVGLVVVAALFYVAAAALAGVVWGGLMLDAEPGTGLRRAWAEGRARARRFMGILLLQVATFVVPIGVVMGYLFGGIAAIGGGPSGPRGMGGPQLMAFMMGTLALELVAIVVIYIAQMVFGWAPAISVVRDLGAIGSYRASWRLSLRYKLDTLVLFLLSTFGAQFLALLVFIIAFVCAVPGLLVLLVGVVVHQLVIVVVGAVVAVMMGVAALLLVGGFLGALQQVLFALACRDLSIADGVISAPPTWQPAPIGPDLPPAVAPA